MITFIGMIQAAIGMVLLVRGSLAAMLGFVMVSGLFGGSAAIILGSGSSIPPVQFALAFIWLRMMIPGSRYLPSIGPGIRDNLWLVVYVVYGVAIAYVAPRLFMGDINVTPLRNTSSAGGLYDVSPLYPSSQNMTASIYLIGTLLTAIAAYVTCLYRGGANTLVKTAVFMSWFHAITGIVVAVGRGTPLDTVIGVFRNATYTQHSQAYEGFVRINGLFPEPSSWAAFAFSWFVFMAECWYRSIEPRMTGRAALVLAAVLFFSTSSTALLGLAAYGAILVMRMAIFPTLASGTRVKEAIIAILAGLVAIAAILLLLPAFTQAVGDMINEMLFAKADSESGRQRLFWAMQGLDGFVVSWGLGIGPGSFRSSSLATAIIGSSGVIGVVSFIAYIVAAMEPRRGSTWGAAGTMAERLGGAAGSAALYSLIPAMVSASSPVPSSEFAILAGAAVALRRLKQPSTSGEEDEAEPDTIRPQRGWRQYESREPI